MLKTGKFQPEFWPTVISLSCFLLCISLGVWQIKRLYWKEDLIQKVETRISSPAVSLPTDNRSIAENEFQRVRVSGKVDLSKAMYFGMYYESQWGVKIVAPTTLEDGRTVFVNLGWVPERKREKQFWEANIPKEIKLDAIIRISHGKQLFAPGNDTVKNYWFWYDFAAMREFASSPEAPNAVLEVVDHKWENKIPVVPTTDVKFPNDHLQYAITWFMLATAIGVIFVVYHLQRAKPAEKPA